MLQALLAIIGSLFLGTITSAQDNQRIIKVSNLDKESGRIFIAWYKNAEDFKKKDKPSYAGIFPVEGRDEVLLTFKNIPSGKYAIALFFDENKNGKMDTNFLGIPKEKYGFSNNVYPMFRGANFKEAAFELPSISDTIKIRLK